MSHELLFNEHEAAFSAPAFHADDLAA